VRAVAAAVGRNPISVVVPCHRVLGSDGSLTGYAGGLPRKAALLALARYGLKAAPTLPSDALKNHDNAGLAQGESGMCWAHSKTGQPPRWPSA
jgi:methylated-DNA-[protein]-cysteine S-methyltransferase